MEHTSVKEAYRIKKGFFGVRYLYLDKLTRVRFGFTLHHLGTTYTLQRKRIYWKEVAWTYSGTLRQELDEIIEYLKWYEYNITRKKIKPLF